MHVRIDFSILPFVVLIFDGRKCHAAQGHAEIEEGGESGARADELYGISARTGRNGAGRLSAELGPIGAVAATAFRTAQCQMPPLSDRGRYARSRVRVVRKARSHARTRSAAGDRGYVQGGHPSLHRSPRHFQNPKDLAVASSATLSRQPSLLPERSGAPNQPAQVRLRDRMARRQSDGEMRLPRVGARRSVV